MSERRWRPRFSLKTFLLLYVMGGCGIAWLAQSYSEYLAEQKALTELSAKISRGTVMVVATNGTVTYPVGGLFC